MKDCFDNICKSCCKKYVKYRREKIKEEEKLNPKPKQKIFYNSSIPKPPDPAHAIRIVRGEVRVVFD